MLPSSWLGLTASVFWLNSRIAVLPEGNQARATCCPGPGLLHQYRAASFLLCPCQQHDHRIAQYQLFLLLKETEISFYLKTRDLICSLHSVLPALSKIGPHMREESSCGTLLWVKWDLAKIETTCCSIRRGLRTGLRKWCQWYLKHSDGKQDNS